MAITHEKPALVNGEGSEWHIELHPGHPKDVADPSSTDQRRKASIRQWRTSSTRHRAPEQGSPRRAQNPARATDSADSRSRHWNYYTATCALPHPIPLAPARNPYRARFGPYSRTDAPGASPTQGRRHSAAARLHLAQPARRLSLREVEQPGVHHPVHTLRIRRSSTAAPNEPRRPWEHGGGWVVC
jgi:hypothetical protein